MFLCVTNVFYGLFYNVILRKKRGNDIVKSRYKLKVNNNKVENRRKHLKAVNAELEERGKALIDRVNAL